MKLGAPVAGSTSWRGETAGEPQAPESAALPGGRPRSPAAGKAAAFPVLPSLSANPRRKLNEKTRGVKTFRATVMRKPGTRKRLGRAAGNPGEPFSVADCGSVRATRAPGSSSPSRRAVSVCPGRRRNCQETVDLLQMTLVPGSICVTAVLFNSLSERVCVCVCLLDGCV